MKKLVLFFTFFTMFFAVNAQDYSVLRYGSTNSETLSVGDTVYVPVIVEDFPLGLAMNYSSGLEYDHSVLNYDTITDTHPNMSNPIDWMVIDNGTSVQVSWFDATLCGVSVNAGDTLCVFVFVYLGGETDLIFEYGSGINLPYLLGYTIDGCVCSNPTLPAIFHVSSNSEWLNDASIAIEQETQQTDSLGISIFNLSEGSYSYVVSKPGYEDASGSFEIADASVIINVDLQESVPPSPYYHTVFPGAEAFFESETAYPTDAYGTPRQHVVGLKVIDSIVSGNSTYYSFYHEFHDQNYTQVNIPEDECVYDDAYSWMGPGFQVFDNGLNVFFNRDNDSLYIYTQANVGDSWTFYSDGAGNDYIATVTDMSFKEFLGITEMVKTISVEGENSFSLEISLNHGLLKTVNFRDFPGFGDQTYQVYQYDLIGLSDPAIGYQKMSTMDVFDYEIGDEVHWEATYGFSGSYEIHYNIDIFTGKEILSEDTVQYIYERTAWFTDPFPQGEFHYDQSTDTMKVSNTPLFDGKLPFENIAGDGFLDKFIMYQTSYNNRMVLKNESLGFGYALIDSNCYDPYPPIGSFSSLYLVKGVGVFHSEGAGSSGSNKELVYFKKGDETWGTPLVDPLGMRISRSNSDIILFPNPAHEFLNIRKEQNSKAIRMKIFDLQGKTVFDKTIKAKSTQIDVRKWNKGMYFYQLRSDNAILDYGKFVVQ